MTEKKKIVEVKVMTDKGGEVPMGIMNASQATKLSDDLDVVISHHDSAAGTVDQEELKPLAGHGAAKSVFPSPTTNMETDRAKEAQTAVRNALDSLVAAANAAGWSTHEIVVAILEAGRFLEKANAADPDPAEDPAISDVAREQIGRGEQYD
ncbi:hypothetical protein [Rhizobium sp. IMFF44]|uniref:hypothetical protein n=1 Tax=Rhizobium sp. IMFF44 TaxID=3342350 RepID=UPI0035BA0E39